MSHKCPKCKVDSLIDNVSNLKLLCTNRNCQYEWEFDELQEYNYFSNRYNTSPITIEILKNDQ